MDMAGLVSFDVIEGWVQFLFSQLMREQSKGFSKISFQQILDCDKYLFTLASHRTMGNLQKGVDQIKPLDATIEALRESPEALQYLMPLPASRSHEAPAASGSRPEKYQKTEKPAKGGGKHGGKPSGNPKVQVPEGCTSHDDDNRPLCFAFQSGKCKFKGPAGKRRVDSANLLYRLAIDIILWCDRNGIVLSIENPANSWLWAALVQLAREHSTAAARALNKLEMETNGLLALNHCLLIFWGRVHEEWTADVYNGDNTDTMETDRAVDTNRGKQADSQKYGTYHTPLQFLSRAQKVQHPMDSTDHLEEPTKFALDFNFRFPSDVVKLERRKNLLQAKLMAARLAEDEKKLHSELPPSLQKVLEGKSLLVWKALLEKCHYDDMGVTAFMFEGVKLVGAHDTPPCFPPMVRPAALTAEGLEASSVWRRKAIVGRVAASDPAHVEHLEETAREELGMGFLEGPFESEAAVTAHLGRGDWCVVRRFVLVQGAEMKLRPIDDCLEAQLNYAYTVTAYLKLQDVDYITGLALRIAEVLKSRNLSPGCEPWLGECLDLSKAYTPGPE
eukprot:s3915_g4.t1